MKRALLCAALAASFLILLTTPATSQNVSIVPNGGISKDMRSETSNRWNMGFNVGAFIYFQASDLISVGGRVAYHSWGADGEGWVKDYNPSVNYTIQSTSGSQSVIEIVPFVRIATSRSDNPVKLYVQVGGGLFLVSPGDVTVKGSFSTPSSYGTGEITFKNESMTGFGIQAGLPISISRLLQILPIYSLYWADGDAYHHYAINIGVTLGN